jgi:hypothetical protein
MRVASIWTFALLASILGCQATGVVVINIGEQQYDLPRHRVVQHRKRSDGRGDSYSPALLTWTREEISAAIPKFAYEAEGVTYSFDVQVYPGFDGNSEPMRDSYLLRGDFSGGVAEFDQPTGLYKVQRRIDRDRWDLLSVPPNPNDVGLRSVNHLWVADCAKPAGFKHAICRMETQYRGNNVSVNVLAQNLVIRGEIFAFIRRELDAAYRGVSPQGR